MEPFDDGRPRPPGCDVVRVDGAAADELLPRFEGVVDIFGNVASPEAEEKMFSRAKIAAIVA